MAKILVTGAAGFIGSNLCERLLKEGNEVIGIDNFYTGLRENIQKLSGFKNFTFMEHDIIKPIDVDCEQIYNLACPASPPHYQKDPIYTLKISIDGIQNMLELANKNNATILQSSTSEVYGNPLVHPQEESYWGNVNPIGIRSCYDEGKRVAETFMMDYHRKYGTKIRIIRIFNTYGPNMDPQDGRVVSNFIIQALKGEDITIYGDGTQTRSFCYVDDLVEGMIRMMNNKQGFIGPVNLGNNAERPINDFAKIVLELIDTKSKITYKALPQDDPLQRKPNLETAKRELDWEPKVDIKDGIRKTIEYFKNKI